MNISEDDMALFATPEAWEQWLNENHGSVPAIWLKIAKKDAPTKSVTYDQALDIALCFGWIDGQKQGHDAHYFLQRFTPRRKGSLWSKRNVIKAIALLEAKKVRPSGLVEIEAAKSDGRWDRAYDSSKSMEVPADFLSALQKNPKAEEFFKSLNKTNLFSIGYRLQTAKLPETRQRRIDAMVERLGNGQTII